MLIAAAALLVLIVLVFWRGGSDADPPGADAEVSTSTQAESSSPPHNKVKDASTVEELSASPAKEEDAQSRWLVKEKGKGFPRYIGPQTADAIMATFFTNLETDSDEWVEAKRHVQLILDRGGIIHDAWYLAQYHGMVKLNMKTARKNPKIAADDRRRYKVSPDASFAELEVGMIDHAIQTAPIRREQRDHAQETGEMTLNVVLNPESRSIGIGRAGPPDKQRMFTAMERYNISRHGIAPKGGYRLRFVEDLWTKREIPPDEVPFFNEKKYVESLCDTNLNGMLSRIPAYLHSPEAQDRSDVEWMVLIDRYDAGLTELASRGQIPEPFAEKRASAAHPAMPSASKSAGGSAPGTLREGPKPPTPTGNASASAESERRKRVAFAYIEALEKAAKDPNIEMDAGLRGLISTRQRELILMLNPELLAPPAPSTPEDEQP